ncbi:MAG TPA: hypothetical protein VMX16_06005 [Terriglobia bacterium]|nr:hypothetical protein [Terriglobia bacterium]
MAVISGHQSRSLSVSGSRYEGMPGTFPVFSIVVQIASTQREHHQDFVPLR